MLYTEDYTKVPGCPKKMKRENFIWNDVSMGKGSAHPVKTLNIKVQNKQLEVEIKRNRCAGVKVCSASGCNFAVGKLQKENKCLRHPDDPLITVDCEGSFVYVYPTDPNDRQRWLGFLAPNKDGHSHACPVSNKPGAKLEEMVADVVKKDPTKKPSDIIKGYGLPCLPAAVAIQGASLKVVSGLRKKYLVNHPNTSAFSMLSKFDTLFKMQIDDNDTENNEDPEIVTRVQEMTTPYVRWHSQSQYLTIGIMMTPHMSEILSTAVIVEADVTFPGSQVLRYLLNIVTFNDLTLRWQTVARALMNKMTKEAYKVALSKILEIVTEDHLQFDKGSNTVLWVVDFSEAQTAAIEATLGERASKVIRGCKVHYMRATQRIADRICTIPEEKQTFLAIANAIPEANG